MWRLHLLALASVAACAGCAGSHISNPPGDAGAVLDGAPPIDAPRADRPLTPEDVDAAVPDAAIPDAAGPDAPAPRCNPTAPFGMPAPLTIVNATGAVDSAPSFAPDGLTLYFSTTRGGGPGAYDIWQSTRATLSGAFTMPTVVANINTGANEYSLTLTPDQRTAYFVSERTDGGALGGGDIWKATRAAAGGTFGLPMLLGDVSTLAQETDPWLTPDGALMFASDRAGSMMNDFWIAPYSAGTGTFLGATRVDELSSPSRDFGATMSGDGLLVALTSDRTGAQFDLYFATRSNRALPFNTPMAFPGMVNSPGSDTGAALSPDGCELVLSSTRGGGADLYLARRP